MSIHTHNPITGVNPRKLSPNDFPVEDLTALGTMLLLPKEQWDKEKIAHSAWIIVGYALKVMTEPRSSHPLMTSIPTDEHHACQLIGECVTNRTLAPWILPLVIQVLQTVLTNMVK